MKYLTRKITLIILIMLLLFVNFSYAEMIVDKRGKVIEEIIKPTAETTIDPDTISDALRYIADEATDYSKKKYTGPSKNIESKDILYSGTNENPKDENYTMIRHTQSITNLNDDEFTLIQDYAKDRLRLKIKIKAIGEFEAKNGFFKYNNKTYYFDDEGLMVLGPAYDEIGNYYFFSYETGELLEEIQKK